MGFQEELTDEGHPITIMINASKRETHTTLQGYKSLSKRLQDTFDVILNKDELTPEVLEATDVVVFGSPQEKFTDAELESIKQFIDNGGSTLFLSSEGGDTKQGANCNHVLKEYGITIKSNCLINTLHEHYVHPKEAFLSDCVLCDELLKFSQGEPLSAPETPKKRKEDESFDLCDTFKTSNKKFNIVYPYGATLTLQKPATAILLSGLMAHPVRQPLGAIWQGGKEMGRVAVLGSVSMFEDSWIEKENNAKFFDFIISWLSASTKTKLCFQLEKCIVDELECSELEQAPDIGALSNRLRCCLQEADELPRDFTRLPDETLFTYRTDLIPEVINLYRKLGVKQGPLTLIAPEFEMSIPPLLPALFPPSLREPPPPPLDLFDLDDCFAPPLVHLARLTNKCKGAEHEDLPSYILDGASTVGIDLEEIGFEDGDKREKSNAILSLMVKKIVDMKRQIRENSLALAPTFSTND